MNSLESGQTSNVDPATLQASDILKPTLQDIDFLQSFVRTSLDDGTEISKNRGKNRRAFENAKNRESTRISKITSKNETRVDNRDGESFVRRGRGDSSREKRGNDNATIQPMKKSIEYELDMLKSLKGRKRSKNVTFRLEEVYTDKDRAAAVNMGTHDIIQSLKMKKRQDRNREFQIPDEAEPSAMLALGAREMRSGDVSIAIKCINKALEISPNDKNALIARSKCYLLLGEPQKALQDAEASLNEKIKDPNNARAMYYKAEALYHLGEFELSLVYYYRGMRIRPEFDQFRLGVQKAKEAIQNILKNFCILDSSMPNASDVSSKSEGKPSSSDELSTNENESEDAEPTSEQIRENNNNNNNNNDDEKLKISIVKSIITVEKRRDSVEVKRKVKPPNLLGQLNVDKKYLQDLLKCPDIKTSYQTSADHIVSHAEEGVAFLENRQEFWRQQRSTNITCSK